jgi:hypothetical protein
MFTYQVFDDRFQAESGWNWFCYGGYRSRFVLFTAQSLALISGWWQVMLTDGFGSFENVFCPWTQIQGQGHKAAHDRYFLRASRIIIQY